MLHECLCDKQNTLMQVLRTGVLNKWQSQYSSRRVGSLPQKCLELGPTALEAGPAWRQCFSGLLPLKKVYPLEETNSAHAWRHSINYDWIYESKSWPIWCMKLSRVSPSKREGGVRISSKQLHSNRQTLLVSELFKHAQVDHY